MDLEYDIKVKNKFYIFLNGDLEKKILYFRIFQGENESLVFCENNACEAVSLYNNKQCYYIKNKLDFCGPTIKVSLKEFRTLFIDLQKRAREKNMNKFIHYDGLVYTFSCR